MAVAMTEYARAAALTLLTEECYDEYLVNYNYFDVPCFKSTLSKGLGFSIIAGSVLVKLPQVLKILSSGSSKGINIYGVLLELFAITASVAYSFVKGFPFSAWGEGTFLGLQTAAIAALVLHFSGAPKIAATFVVTYAAAVSFLLTSAPVDLLWSLQASNVPIVLAGKMIQAHTNYKNGSTGQLSAVTCLLLFFGSLMRIFTSIQETGDMILVLTYVAASVANGIIVMQLIWYWNADKTIKNADKVTKKKKKKA